MANMVQHLNGFFQPEASCLAESSDVMVGGGLNGIK